MSKRFAALAVFLAVGAFFLTTLGGSGLEDGGWLKAALVPIATLYLNAFNSPSTAIVLCFAMLVVAALLLAHYWLNRIAPARKEIIAAAEEIRDTPGKPGSRETLEAIDEVMVHRSLLSRPWSVFRNTFVPTEGGSVVLRVPPAQYFDMRALEAAGIRLRFFLGLPNDFVGLGLIFTFLGLVAGLYFATRSMMSSDIGVARDALVLLLHAATFKFLTSITGIGVSLVLSWSQRALVDGLQGALYDLQFALEERLPPNDVERLPVLRPRPLRTARLSAKPTLRHLP